MHTDGGDRLWNWLFLQLLDLRDLNLGSRSRYMAYRRVSLIDLYIHSRFCSSQTNFLWTDVQTDVQADGHWHQLYWRSQPKNDCNIGRNDPVNDVICTYINQVGDKIPKYNIHTSTNA